MITRQVEINNEIKKGRVLVIYGSRQVGKTTLINNFLATTKLKYKMVTGDDIQLAAELSECTMTTTTNFVGNYELLVIDEAQKIENIGRALKLMVDHFPDRYFIATGSSSFDLASKTAESLTGRKNVIELFTISQAELLRSSSKSELTQELESYLIYGSYPDVINQHLYQEKERVIKQIANSYLLKDVLAFEGIKNSKVILSILKMIALQVGSEVSTVEIANSVKVDYRTVAKYLDLLEKSFVIFSLPGFSRNLRKEISKMSKYYFYDLGIRNALISNFSKLSSRNDVGQLWENFVMIERMKNNSYMTTSANYYFWRTHDQKEIDLIEERGGKLYGYEIKWTGQRTKSPKLWLETYENAEYKEIDRENYLDFVTR
ncbi:MAG: ATP-binding protein [bacterium]